MASNGSWLGVISGLTDRPLPDIPLSIVMSIAIAALATILLHTFAVPRLDPREPPMVKPRIPLIGHIISLIQHQAAYHTILRRRTNKPIATLPMLNGKIYAIWDPVLVAAGLRNKHLSNTPQIKSVARPLCGITAETDAILQGPMGDKLIDDIMHSLAPALFGEHLRRMNTAALSYLGEYFNEFAGVNEQKVSDVWMWVRELMTQPTAKAVFGDHDPFSKEPGLEQALWDLEHDFLKLALGVLPSVIAPAGDRARALITRVLTDYYGDKRDLDLSASTLVRVRAAILRNNSIPNDDLSRIEILLPFAAMTNTVPTLFWLFSFIVSRPDLVLQLRNEVESAISKREGDQVTIMVSPSAVEERCPLLWSCYRETLRTTIHQISTRTVMQDTMLRDGKGREYLLKADTPVQMSLGTLNTLEEYWGPNAAEFDPTRFLEFSNRSTMAAAAEGPGSPKAMRAAFIPFGGGAHLCPGRMFAATEMMAFKSTLVLGYDVEPLEGKKWEFPSFGPRSMIDAVAKPAKNGKGFGVRIRRRQGWEGVRWDFTL